MEKKKQPYKIIGLLIVFAVGIGSGAVWIEEIRKYEAAFSKEQQEIEALKIEGGKKEFESIVDEDMGEENRKALNNI